MPDPLSLAVAAAVVVILVFYGPKKVPELARALGQAKREFEQSKREAEGT